MKIIGVTALLVLVHIGMTVADIFSVNLNQALSLARQEAYFGGEGGFLPSTGDDQHPYDQFTGWLRQGGQIGEDDGSRSSQLDDPADAEGNAPGGVALLQYIVRAPLCTLSQLVRFNISLAVLNYETLDLLPDEGFGYWFKLAIHTFAFGVTIVLASRLVQFALRAGIFSSPYLMAAVLGIAILGTISTIAEGAGGLVCG